MRKIKTTKFVKFQLIEFDSFGERDVEQRRKTIKKTISQMGPKTCRYEVISTIKGWKTKKLVKALTMQPDGQITILGVTEESKEVFSLSDVYQIVWSEGS